MGNQGTKTVMFRTKAKKVGTATRKRRDFDDGDENEEQLGDGPKAEPMDVDAAEIPASMGPVEEPNDPLNGDDEEAMLARMRSRVQKNKAKSGGAMAFRSRSMSAKKSVKSVMVDDEEEAEGATTTSASGGCLSFEEDAATASKSGSKKMRIRPNLHVSHTSEEADEEDPAKASMYSHDMLASLLREQKVLLRRAPPSATVEDMDADVMEVDEEGPTIDEETKGESPDEEFIPLNAKIMQAKRNKKRVTFGMQNEEFYPPKDAEVEEPVPTSDVEDDDERDESKRWEEELMRRGGRHVPAPQPSPPRYDAKAVYPTRRRVPCASLGEVMRSIQRKMDAGSTERDRVARELARLDAESELIQKKLAQQREELLVSSEQFEYFQVIEDFVKGLSFCLREKLPLIESEEKRRESMRLASRAKTTDQRETDIQAEIQAILRENKAQDRQFVNLPLDMRLQAGDEAINRDEDERLVRFRKRYTDSPMAETTVSTWDVFADAVEEINSLEHVYGRFQEWKTKFPDVYKDAYTDLALSKLFAPYIRVELINWDPLAVAMNSVHTSSSPSRVSEMAWFKTLQQHRSLGRRETEEPVSSLLRDLVLSRIMDASKTRFDPFSPVHTQSIVDLVEDLFQLNTPPQVDHGVEDIAGNVVSTLTAEAKRLPVLALDQAEAGNDRMRIFASFLVGELCALLENALVLFVALPTGPLQDRGFAGVMQILHHVLAYVTHCKHLDKTAMLPQIQRTVDQFSSLSFKQRLLARSTGEQLEFQHMLQLVKA